MNNCDNKEWTDKLSPYAISASFTSYKSSVIIPSYGKYNNTNIEIYFNQSMQWIHLLSLVCVWKGNIFRPV